jgi:hypothetical protein
MNRKIFVPAALLTLATLGGGAWLLRDAEGDNPLPLRETVSESVGVALDEGGNSSAKADGPVERVVVASAPPIEPEQDLPERPAVLDVEPDGCHVLDDAVMDYWRAMRDIDEGAGQRAFDEITDPCKNEEAEDEARVSEVLDTSGEVFDLVGSALEARGYVVVPTPDNPLLLKFRRSGGMGDSGGDGLERALAMLSEESILFMDVESDEDGSPIYRALYGGNSYVDEGAQGLADQLIAVVE